jgi:hypothetical protein
MTRAEKIQAAIDALPNATGGDWKPDGRVGIVRTKAGYVNFAFPIMQLRRTHPDGDDIRANLALASAAKDLAEEVVRLRALVREAFEKGFFHGHRDGGCQRWDDVWPISGFQEKISQPLPTPEPD